MFIVHLGGCVKRTRPGIAGKMGAFHAPYGTRSALTTLPWLAAALVALAGCRADMYEQPKYNPMEPSSFFDDGTSARPRVAGTVARGELRIDDHFYQGKVNGLDADTFPIHVTQAVIERGQERYRIYCVPCHGELGDGNGMIVQRGFPKPPSYHEEPLRSQPVGHYFDVISRGHGVMYSYAARVAPDDRWAIVAYIRALQLSQHAEAASLPESDRARLEETAR
jgi:mono/diheme cytochrome c family protein